MFKENSIIKDWRNVDFSFGLIYPNISKIGLSSYAIRLLYFLINSYENIVCERIFLPEKVKYPARAYHNPKNQIRSIETNVFLDEFDILGFSLQFENDFRNVLWILEDSLIPLTFQARINHIKDDRTHFPLIIAGGAVATSNPLPFSPFFDLMFIGDSEPNLNLFFKVFEDYVNNKIKFKELVERAQSIEGIYVPLLKNKVKRAVQLDLDQAQIPKYQVLSYALNQKPIFERNYFIEVNRGCPFQCKFCISSFHNAPFRNRSYEKILEAIDHGLKNFTFDIISLIGSCVSAHPKFYEICEYIINKGKKFSSPSLRIEHITSEIIQVFERSGIKTITIAPESGSESLRYELGKKISDEKIYSVVEDLKKSKIRSIKFYFLIGLPDEKEEDIDKTISMIKTIGEMGFQKNSLKISINPLIPKFNTPYEREIDFFLQDNINKFRLNYQNLHNELKKLPAIKLKFQNIRNIINQAKLQALISLGDQDVSLLLKNYYYEGANFGALRKVEKLEDFTMNDYFIKIKKGYTPWKL